MLPVVLWPSDDLVLVFDKYRGSLVVLLFVRSVGNRVEESIIRNHRAAPGSRNTDCTISLDFRVLPVYYIGLAYTVGTTYGNLDGFNRILR